MPAYFNSLITADELRSRIGNPTTDSAEVAPVTDEELQDIIDQHKNELENQIMARIEQRVLNSQPIAPRDAMEMKRIPLNDTSGKAATGNVPNDVYPYTFEDAVSGEGEYVVYDSDLEQETNTFFTRKRYKFVGDHVYVIPDTISEIKVPMPLKIEVNERIGPDLIKKTNDSILNDAWQMLQNKIKEGSRLRGQDYYGSDHDQ